MMVITLLVLMAENIFWIKIIELSSNNFAKLHIFFEHQYTLTKKVENIPLGLAFLLNDFGIIPFSLVKIRVK